MLQFSYTIASEYFKEQLKGVYSLNESGQFAKMFFEHHLNYVSTDFLIRKNEIISDDLSLILIKSVHRLKKEEPIQYILGKAWFRDLQFDVSPSVLIPRQETEELVDWMVKDNSGNALNILDIGTGSGCIALALKNEIPQSNVSAWDISDKALNIAKINAQNNLLTIDFQQHDILTIDTNNFGNSFDLIVSNPPYVLNREKEKMHTNVLNHEPHLALFVDNDDPLIFYRAIAQKAKIMLSNHGKLYFEINEAMGREMIDLLQSLGYINIELRKDINGKDRMIKAIKA